MLGKCCLSPEQPSCYHAWRWRTNQRVCPWSLSISARCGVCGDRRMTLYSPFLCKKSQVSSAASWMEEQWKTKIYKQYLEIEIARRRNGRVDRPGLDDDNATSLKHGNEAFLDYMLDSVFVGSKWINWLVEPVIAYSPPQSEKSEKSNIISIFFTSPGSAPEYYVGK